MEEVFKLTISDIKLTMEQIHYLSDLIKAIREQRGDIGLIEVLERALKPKSIPGHGNHGEVPKPELS